MKAPHKILWIRIMLCALTCGFFFGAYPYCSKCGREMHFSHSHEGDWDNWETTKRIKK